MFLRPPPGQYFFFTLTSQSMGGRGKKHFSPIGLAPPKGNRGSISRAFMFLCIKAILVGGEGVQIFSFLVFVVAFSPMG